MSRENLHKILKKAPDQWSDNKEDKNKRHARYCHASEIIEGQDLVIAKLEKQQTILQNLLANYAGTTASGANDPNVLEALSFGDDEDYED